MKPPGLSQATQKPSPASSGVVLRADVVAPVAVALLGAAGVHGVIAGVDQAEFAPGLDDAVEDVGRELGRDIEFPAQLADIGDPARPDAGIADLELARGAEREGRVGQILAGQLLQQRRASAAP